MDEEQLRQQREAAAEAVKVNKEKVDKEATVLDDESDDGALAKAEQEKKHAVEAAAESKNRARSPDGATAGLACCRPWR